jgi:hypothetical protein
MAAERVLQLGVAQLYSIQLPNVRCIGPYVDGQMRFDCHRYQMYP